MSYESCLWQKKNNNNNLGFIIFWHPVGVGDDCSVAELLLLPFLTPVSFNNTVYL